MEGEKGADLIVVGVFIGGDNVLEGLGDLGDRGGQVVLLFTLPLELIGREGAKEDGGEGGRSLSKCFGGVMSRVEVSRTLARG